jgi:GTP-binding protein YchF
MGFTLGIIGLPNVGKSTLFNVLSKAKAEVSNYPFCTIKPNVGIVEVPDERLARVQNFMGSAKAIPSVIEFYDIAGLVKGAHKGEGLGNQFLSHIREVEAIAHVVRCFETKDIAHVAGKVDPIADIETIEVELNLADMAIIDNKLENLKIKAKAGDKKYLRQAQVLQRIRDALDNGIAARKVALSESEKPFIKDLPLLTFKPVLYVANVDESGNPRQVKKLLQFAQKEEAKVVEICAKLEAEITELSSSDAQAFLLEMGMKEAGLARLIRAGYNLLGLITFFTANQKESRAWAVRSGTRIPQAAGKIHTDMERGFISSEVLQFEDLIRCGSYSEAREKGLLHTEGKTYIVQDGDLVLIKFNV